jgi:hypothetical protein
VEGDGAALDASERFDPCACSIDGLPHLSVQAGKGCANSWCGIHHPLKKGEQIDKRNKNTAPAAGRRSKTQ